MGHRVSVFATELAETNKESGVWKVKPTPFHRIRSFAGAACGRYDYAVLNWGESIAATICRVHLDDPFDIFEMEESFGWCGAVMKRVPVPLVVKLHGPAFLTQTAAERNTALGRAKVIREGEALRHASAILAPSSAALAPTLDKYKLTPRLSRVIPNPIVLDQRTPLWDLRNCDTKTILFVGRFDELKGGDTMLVIFKRILATIRDAKLVFVGPDRGIALHQGANVFFNTFRDSLFTKAEAASVSYLGYLPPNDILALRTRALVSVVPSRWETQPYTALEAMLQGCPVVAFATGGINEAIEHESTGLLARADDVDDLYRQVMRLLRDPALGKTLGARAREFVMHRHSASIAAKATIEAYRQTIAMREAQ